MERRLGLVLIIASASLSGCFSEGTWSDDNPTLKLRPGVKSLAVNNSFTFTTLGGKEPLVFSVSAGGGSIVPATGHYTAPGTAGTATVRVTDADGAIAESAVTINPTVSLSPATKSLAGNTQFTFTASNGVPPYTFSVASGTGSINASTGLYTAPASAGTAVVQVVDSLGNLAQSNVTLSDALVISPASKTMLVSGSFTFTASGGVGARTFSVVSGGGSINAGTGAYTAPGTAGSVVVRVTDSLGNTADSAVTVNGALAISPTSKTLVVNATQTFTASGGIPPYTYSRPAGTGTVNGTSGLYTAPASSGTATVRVTDSLGATADATVTVNGALAISPTTKVLSTGEVFSFSASGGVAPYTYSRTSGTGSINSSTGAYTAPASPGTAIVTVTDSLGATSSAGITINPALEISPATRTIATGGSYTFSASNGTPPYTFSVPSGTGSVNASTGQYTAGAPAISTVRVTDSAGKTADATVTVNGPLAITPVTKTLAANNQFTFAGSAGVPPYTYSVIAGGGNINSSTGLYTAPAAAGSATVRVTDADGSTADSTVTINAALAITPASKTIQTNDVFLFGATGGVPPLAFSVQSGTGTIDPSTGSYTAPASFGSATVRVTDSAGNTADSAVSIYAPLVISPTSKALAVGNSYTFLANNGIPPYTFSLPSGAGSINASTGMYTAPGVSGTATVRVTDSVGNFEDSTVTINPALQISPTSINAVIGNPVSFSAVGGVTPYTYSVVSGTGTINSSTGAYSASSSAETATIRVTDAIGNTSNATVRSHFYVSANEDHACAIVTGNVLKCWGRNDDGRLGLGDVNSRGDAASEMGANLPAVSLGTGRKVKMVAAGANHNCAILDNDTVKCWGLNTYGQLGLGHVLTIGDGSGEMGDDLPTVNLGTGKTAIAIGAGQSHSCALLNDFTVKCWGRNLYGQLGIGNTTTKGIAPAEMGDALAAVSLGTGRTAVALQVGKTHNCVVLDDGSTKCWGRNNSGQIGFGSVTVRGDAGAELGNGMPVIDYGTGRTAVGLRTGQDRTCAILDNATLKCFGLNAFGELGLGSTTNRGDGANEMGNNLPAVSLGTGRTPYGMDSGLEFTCVVLDDYSVKCFGRSTYGQLGYGDTVTRGDGAGEMGDTLPAVNLGTGRTALMVTTGNYFSCAVLDDDTVKCWGRSDFGQLGQGDVNSRGDGANEMGDNLPTVSLF